MSHVSHKQKGKIPCEFAAMGDCWEADSSDYCKIYSDPNNCPSYHRRMVCEGEETREEYDAWEASVNRKNISGENKQK